MSSIGGGTEQKRLAEVLEQLQKSDFYKTAAINKNTVQKRRSALFTETFRLLIDAIVDPMNEGNLVLMSGGGSACQ